jgi:hypothetical protein
MDWQLAVAVVSSQKLANPGEKNHNGQLSAWADEGGGAAASGPEACKFQGFGQGLASLRLSHGVHQFCHIISILYIMV